MHLKNSLHPMGATLQTLLQQHIIDTWNNVHSQSKQKALGSILTTHYADTRCGEGEFCVHVEITDEFRMFMRNPSGNYLNTTKKTLMRCLLS